MHGHLAARLDPLGSEPIGDPALEPETVGLTPEIMAQIPSEVLRIQVPGSTLAEALPHLHEAHETAILVLEGRARMRYGDGLSEELEVGSGEFLYIPAGMPHQPFNPSDEPCRAVIARTDPNEQESIVLLDAQARKS